MIGWERYRVVFRHEYVDTDGKTYKLEDPIAVEQIITNDIKKDHVPKATIVNSMLRSLAEGILERM